MRDVGAALIRTAPTDQLILGSDLAELFGRDALAYLSKYQFFGHIIYIDDDFIAFGELASQQAD